MRAPSAADEPRKPPKRRAHPERASGLSARAVHNHEPGGYLQRPAYHSLPQARRPALPEPRRVRHRVVRPPRRLARSGGREAAAHPHPAARQVGHPREVPNISPGPAGSESQTAAPLGGRPRLSSPLGSSSSLGACMVGRTGFSEDAPFAFLCSSLLSTALPFSVPLTPGLPLSRHKSQGVSVWAFACFCFVCGLLRIVMKV